MKNLKKSKALLLVLSITLVLSFGQMVTAQQATNTANAPLTQLTTEEGKTFGVGEPKVKNGSAKSIKHKRTMKKNEVEQSTNPFSKYVLIDCNDISITLI